jgi:hypothetical protein
MSEAGIADWHDFFLLTGTAAATLAGLVFVALTLRPEALDRDSRPGARALARQLFGNFVGVLLLSLLALIPGQGREALGVEFVLAGALGVATTVARLRRIGWAGERGWRSSAGLGLGTQTLVVLGGAAVFAGLSLGPYLYGVAAAAILMLAFVNTWQLVTR